MSEDDAHMMRKCVKNIHLLRIEIRICAAAHDAHLRTMRRLRASAHIMRILYADAQDAQKRICAYYAHILCASAHDAHLRILRIIYDSAHIMHIICLDAHDGRMRIICAECAGCADAHIMRIMRRCALCAYA